MVAASGIFTVVTWSSAGQFIKVANDGSGFLEVGSLGISANVSFGTCASR